MDNKENKQHNTIEELEAYIIEMKKSYEDKLTKEDAELNIDNLIPKRDILNDGKEDKKDKENKKDKKDDGESGLQTWTTNTKKKLHYTTEEAFPYLPLSTASEALKAINELENIKKDRRNFVVVCLSDSGERQIWFAKTFEEAKAFMDKSFKDVMHQIEWQDKLKTVYVEEGTGEKFVHEPTPKKYVDDDGTYKCVAIVDGKVHSVRKEMYSGIYNELTNETIRWDIFNIESQKKVEDVKF